MKIVDRSYLLPGGRLGFLLIHGLGGTPVEMRFVARGLARAGHTVHCPQLAGHCGTYQQMRATNWQDWYGSVEAAHDQLKKQCDVIIVGGLSVGAILALHLAAQRPNDVHGTALYAPTLRLNGWSMPWYACLFSLVTHKWCADLIDFVERDPNGLKDPRVRAMVMEALQSGDSSQAGQLATPGSSFLEMRWLVNIVKRELAQIKQPSLIIHPREDDRADFASNTGYLQRKLGGLVDTVVLDDSYHIVTLDRQRDLVVERTNTFAAWLAARVQEDKGNVVEMRAPLESRPAPVAHYHHRTKDPLPLALFRQAVGSKVKQAHDTQQQSRCDRGEEDSFHIT